MRVMNWAGPIALGGLLLSLACTGEEQVKRVETEVGNLKLEVFKLRTQMEEANQRGEEERNAAAAGRNQDRRFQADLQESLRQLQETTRILNNRLGDVPQAGRNKPAGKPGPAPEAPVQNEDDKAFNAAMLDYNRGNYALAAESLEFYIKSHPQGTRVPDAIFSLGLSHYNQKSYDKAQLTFEQIVKDYPSCAQFLPAKLKRAQCLLKQGLKPAAVKGFQELKDQFEGSPEARRAKEELVDLGL